MKTLDQISVECGTDKGSLHGYTLTYEKYFEPLRDKPISILEIGVQFGNSLRMWAEYFPNAKIIGLDSVDNKNKFDNPRIQELRGDQSNPNHIEAVKMFAPFDIIIDDGSHYSHDINNSLRMLFDSVKPGGFYCIEDLHATYLKQFNPAGGMPAMQNLFQYVNTLNEFGNGQCGKQDDNAKTAFMHFYKSLCIIGRK